MFLYIVPIKGDGTEENMFRPDIPTGYNWLGEQLNNQLYFVLTKKPLPNDTKYKEIPITKELVKAALKQYPHLDLEDIRTWYLKDDDV